MPNDQKGPGGNAVDNFCKRFEKLKKEAKTKFGVKEQDIASFVKDEKKVMMKMELQIACKGENLVSTMGQKEVIRISDADNFEQKFMIK